MVPMTGKAVMAGTKMQEILSPGVSTEIMYSFIIIACSLMIYFGTRELYTLSNHKGIGYFRKAFLFFALAYFFRSFIKIVLSYISLPRLLNIPPEILARIVNETTMAIFLYFSTMAIFYLLASVMWKKWNEKSNKIIFLHSLALITALIVIITKNPLIYLATNILLLLLVIFIVQKHKHQKKHHSLHIIYILLMSFWIINIIDILIPNFFRTFQLLIYLISSGLFLTMLYKVLRKIGSN